MKKILILTLMLLSGLFVSGQVKFLNQVIQQIAKGDTITQRIYNGYDTFDGSNPIYLNYYDSVGFLGNRGMGISGYTHIYDSAKIDLNLKVAGTHYGNTISPYSGTTTVFTDNVNLGDNATNDTTFQIGKWNYATGAGAGKLWQSDVNGIGSWQTVNGFDSIHTWTNLLINQITPTTTLTINGNTTTTGVATFDSTILFDGNLGTVAQHPDSIFTDAIIINGIITYYWGGTLLDDGTIVLPVNISGHGIISVSNADTISASAYFEFGKNGYVHLTANVNTVATNTDGNELCIFDNGAGIAIRIRNGHSSDLNTTIWRED